MEFDKVVKDISTTLSTHLLKELIIFIDKVSSVTKKPKEVESIINTIVSKLNEKTLEEIKNINKRQEHETKLIKEKNERDKLPKCTFNKKDKTVCNKPCKSSFKNNDEYVCDEHYKHLSSIRNEPCYFTGCTVPVKIDAVPIETEGFLNNLSYKGAFVCKKHFISITKALEKQANPCMYIVKSKNGEKKCDSIAIADGRCKKHTGKEQKVEPAPDKKEELKHAPKEPLNDIKRNKVSSKTNIEETANDAHEDPKKVNKALSKKKDKSSDEEKIEINFKNKRKLNWVEKKDKSDDSTIYIDANSGLVASKNKDEMIVWAIWDHKNNTTQVLSEESKKYAKKHNLTIHEEGESTDEDVEDNE
jgi:hypothetical protein